MEQETSKLEQDVQKPDLTLAALNLGINAPLGLLVGAARSLADPFAIIHEIRYIEKNKGINTISEYSAHLFGTIGYGAGIYEIISRLHEDPTDVKNYIPLITNFISACVQIGYSIGKKKGKEDGDTKGFLRGVDYVLANQVDKREEPK